MNRQISVLTISLLGKWLPVMLALCDRLAPQAVSIPVCVGYLAIITWIEYKCVLRPLVRAAQRSNTLMAEAVEEFLSRATIDGQHPRLLANVLICRWGILGHRFYPVYEYGMERSPYANLCFFTKHGFCGEVHRSPDKGGDAVDFRSLTPHQIISRFNWPPKYQRLTERVKAIRIVPIIRERRRLFRLPDEEVFGLLCFYAEDNDAADYLLSSTAKGAATRLAKTAGVLYDY